MEKIIWIDKVVLSYCMQCSRPAVVGEIKVRGWCHKILICDICISEMKNEILSLSTQAIEEVVRR